MSSWSELPPELVLSITHRNDNYVDYLSARAVCKSWRAAIPKRPRDLLCRLPWLLLPYHKDAPDHRGFYSLSDGKTYRLEMPEAIDKRCCGSSHGWLVMFEESPGIFLFNPLTKARIELPSLSTIPNFPSELVCENCRNFNPGFKRTTQMQDRDTFIRKAIVSGDPSLITNFMVMAIYSVNENLAFCRSGDVAWSIITETSPPVHYKDIMFQAGKSYIVDEKGNASICNTDHNPPTMIHVANPPPVPPTMGYKQWYLGDLDDHLTLFGRFRKFSVPGYDYQTTRFVAYRLDSSNSSWSEMDNIGDRIVFLGWNSLHSIYAPEYRSCCCKRNCIYFTDDYFVGLCDFTWEGYDFGVFDMNDGSVRRLGNLPCFPIKLPRSPVIYFNKKKPTPGQEFVRSATPCLGDTEPMNSAAFLLYKF